MVLTGEKEEEVDGIRFSLVGLLGTAAKVLARIGWLVDTCAKPKGPGGP